MKRTVAKVSFFYTLYQRPLLTIFTPTGYNTNKNHRVRFGDPNVLNYNFQSLLFPLRSFTLYLPLRFNPNQSLQTTSISGLSRQDLSIHSVYPIDVTTVLLHPIR